MTRDWTHSLAPRDQDPDKQTVYEAFMQVDWQCTALGPTQSWSPDLRAHVRHLFEVPTANAMYIGEELVMIYNGPSLAIYKNRHPFMMGKPIAIAFADLEGREGIFRQIKDTATTGVSGHVPMVPMKIHRNELSRSTMDILLKKDDQDDPDLLVVSWDIVPLMNDDAQTFGISLPLTDCTELYLTRAKDQLLRKLDLQKGQDHEHSMQQAYETIAGAFESEPLLLPMAMMFVPTVSGNSDIVYRCCVNVGSSYESDKVVRMNQSKVPEQQLDELLNRAYSTGMTETLDAPIEMCLARSLGVKTKHARIYPIYASENSLKPDWLLLLSANPMRRLDEQHQETLSGIASSVSTGLRYLAQQSALKQSERRFKDIVELLPIAIQLEDRRSRTISYVNPYWRNLYDVPSDLPVTDASLLPRAINAVDPRSASAVEQYKQIQEESDHMRSIDIQLKRPPAGRSLQSPDEETWVRTDTKFVGDSELVVVASNVSDYYNGLRKALALSKLEVDHNIDRHRADLAEKQTQDHLDFLDYFSHELRNPLGAIFHSVESCLEKVSSSFSSLEKSLQTDLNEDLLTINLCSQHMQRIMDDTLLFSQLQSGNLSICKVPTKVLELFDLVLRMFRSECRAKNIDLTLDTSNWRHGALTLLLDPNRLTQILINLVTNSMKFTPKNKSGKIIVKLESSQSSDGQDHVSLAFSVVDNGLPMKDEEIARLFQRFQQANKKTHVLYGGSGLGLYICRQLIGLLGGTIGASRNDLGGTTFSVALSAQVVDESAQIEEEAPGASNSSASKSAPRTRRSSQVRTAKRVLLVEDNIINQRLLEKQLTRSGYTVLLANNGQEALDLFKSPDGPSVDICLCDIEMPILNGYETVERVREHQATHHQPATPFLAISANARAEQVRKQLDSGMNDSLAKPFKFPDLVRKLEEVFAACHVDREGH